MQMSGNIFGQIFRVISFGESHGVAVGVVVDGCPSNIPITLKDFDKDLEMRSAKPKRLWKRQFSLTTLRCEKDKCHILSGIANDKTLGTPIALFVKNRDIRVSHYKKIQDIYRPGHADLTYEEKFGIPMQSGGGRASGRETVARVMAGTVARKMLEKMAKDKGYLPIKISTRLKEIAGIKIKYRVRNEYELDEEVASQLKKIIDEGDSMGAVLECTIKNVPSGLGEPVFCKLEAMLSQAVMSIGGVKGIEFGNGFDASRTLGSVQNNISKNLNGGIFGGISSGDDVYFSVALKPVPSIKKIQKVLGKDGTIREASISGRHDACLFPRVIPVVEAMCYITLADATLLQLRNC